MSRIALYGLGDSLARELRRAGHSLLKGDDPTHLPASCDLAMLGLAGDRSDGLGWCRAVRTADPHFPVLGVVSGDEEARLALEAGASDVLRRPFGSELLLARVSWMVRCTTLRRELVDSRRAEMESTSRAVAAAHELVEAKEYLERLLDASPDAIIAADTRSSVVVFSRAAERLLGYRVDEVIGSLKVADLYTDIREARQVMAAIRHSPALRVENRRVRLRASNGEPIKVMLSAALLRDASGQPAGTVGVFRDNRAADSLSLRLEKATLQLIRSEKRAATIEVAGAAAHELNQPLTSVMGLLELLSLREDLDAGALQRIQRAYQQLERMAGIVRRLSEVTSFGTTSYVEGVDILDLGNEEA